LNSSRVPTRRKQSTRKACPPMFGAHHCLVWDRSVHNFFYNVDSIWREAGRGKAFYGNSFNADPPKRYSIYDDPTKNLGLFVLERHLSKKQASRNQLRWTRQDVGRIKQDIGNESNGTHGIVVESLLRDVELSTAVRVSDAYSQGEGTQISLIVKQSTPQAGFLLKEHQLSIAGLGRNLKNFTYPYSDYIPNLKIGRLFTEIGESRVEQCIDAVQQLLPLHVELKPIQFYSHQEVT
jgi:hypothetical protein